MRMGAAMAGRRVFHIDLDAFFANAEVLRRPELAGQPVVVGGDEDGRGVVSSATYAARAFGVRSAMPAAHARRLCPDAIFLRPDFPYYRDLSGRFRTLLHDLSPLVEIASIDEAYLEVGARETVISQDVTIPPPMLPTADCRLPNDPLAEAIKARFRAETGLTCSVGVATNKTLAKIASDLRKPDGLVVVPRDAAGAAAFLAPLPAGALPGVGPKAQARLLGYGLRTIGDLATAPPSTLRQIFGERIAAVVALRARGVDDRPLETESAAKTLGHERTFSADIADLPTLRRVIRDLAEQAAAQLRRAGLGGRSVQLKLRDETFETLGRQRALGGSTELAEPIRATAEALLDELMGASGTPWYGRRIRLLGVRVGGLGPLARQLDLFDETPQRDARLHAALDRLHERFGPGAIGRAGGVLPRTPRR